MNGTAGTTLVGGSWRDVPARCGLASDEVFGPAAGVFPFDHEDEVVARANATELGLAAYFFTGDAGRVWRLGDALEAGIIGVNTGLPSAASAPMGGVKQSGLGREGGSLGMEEFEEVRYLCQGQ